MKRREVIVGAAALLPAAAARAQAPADADVVVRLQTDQGAINLRLAATAAPLTTANFLRYVDTRRFDGASFYRAARAKGVDDIGLIEGGLQNDPDKLLPSVAHESTTATGLSHHDGVVSMARDAPGTATADFFICSGPSSYLDAHPDAPGDNAGYAAFGQVIAGMDVVRAILRSPTGGPARNPVMQGQILDTPVRIVSAVRV